MKVNTNRFLSLLQAACAVPSVTQSKGEHDMAEWLYTYIQNWTYFKNHGDDVFLQPVTNDPFARHNVVAFVRATVPTEKTIVFINHFDVVDTDVCGQLKDVAFQLDAYKTALFNEMVSADVQADLQSDEWLFGRGVMDMKAGMSIQLELLHCYTESEQERPVNLLWIGLCDEEINGLGSQEAAYFLRERMKHGEEIVAIINSEPSITKGEAKKALIHTGTIGKYLPFAYVIGKEAHVGEYDEGINASVIAAEFVQRLEANEELEETYKGKTYPPPTCLYMRDLKETYSVTLNERVVTYFNVLGVTMTPEHVLDVCKREAQQSLRTIHERWEKKGRPSAKLLEGAFVYDVATLLRRSQKTYHEWTRLAERGRDGVKDVQEQCIALLNELVDELRLKGPGIIVGFLPPICPAVVSEGNKQVERWVTHLQQKSEQLWGMDLYHEPVYEGISDFSQFGCILSQDNIQTFTRNLVGWGEKYRYPFEVTTQFNIPLINLGPIGKDAHKKTERLYVPYVTEQLPTLLDELISEMAKSTHEKTY